MLGCGKRGAYFQDDTGNQRETFIYMKLNEISGGNGRGEGAIQG